jgi:hypothetical protein
MKPVIWLARNLAFRGQFALLVRGKVEYYPTLNQAIDNAVYVARQMFQEQVRERVDACLHIKQ